MRLRWRSARRAFAARERERDTSDRNKIVNLPIAVESDGRVGQNSQHKTDGRPGVTIDTEKAALLGILPPRAGDNDEISRPSWMHRLQFHCLEQTKKKEKENHEEVSDYLQVVKASQSTAV